MHSGRGIHHANPVAWTARLDGHPARHQRAQADRGGTRPLCRDAAGSAGAGAPGHQRNAARPPGPAADPDTARTGLRSRSRGEIVRSPATGNPALEGRPGLGPAARGVAAAAHPGRPGHRVRDRIARRGIHGKLEYRGALLAKGGSPAVEQKRGDLPVPRAAGGADQRGASRTGGPREHHDHKRHYGNHA
ncbi:MAG: hypothetical protein BWY59_01755 [Verrucomicrobia bacterium ADurb.Bin345]|nr:MAG: hypothetical protein BWY59_01755 [Verrucomicrobia bacterium ADurb.Bin345]